MLKSEVAKVYSLLSFLPSLLPSLLSSLLSSFLYISSLLKLLYYIFIVHVVHVITFLKPFQTSSTLLQSSARMRKPEPLSRS